MSCLWALGMLGLCAVGSMAKSDGPARVLAVRESADDLTFDGIGAVSAGASSRLLIDYPEPVRGHLLDLLFKPKYGAAFQHLKVEVGGDMNSTDGTEPSHMRRRGEASFDRGYEWWLMREAVKRNPNIVLDCLAWGAPGWFGGGFWSRDCAEYYASFIKGAKERHGLTIRYVGLWNEREFDPAFVKLLRRTLDASGLEDVGIVASDMNGPPEHQWKAAMSAAADPALASAISVFGIHYPYTVPPAEALEFQKSGKKLWSSEDGEWDWKTMRPLRGLRAQKLNRNILERRLTKTEFWSPITSYYGCLPAPDSGVITANRPWSGEFAVKDELWHVAHTTHFVQPGWRMLQVASSLLDAGGSVVAYRSPDGRDLSVVIETAGAKSTQKVVLRWEGSRRALRQLRTDAQGCFIELGNLRPVRSEYTVEVAPDTVLTLTTVTGGRRPRTASPAAQPFPLPYREDFDRYRVGATPRYLSDFSWAFEVAPGQGRNRILRQVIERQGITWVDLPYAATYTGDLDWSDVQVSADAGFDASPAHDTDWVAVVARARPGSTWDRFKDPFPAGYSLALLRDGRWRLCSATKVLQEGRLAGPVAEWNRLELTLDGTAVRARVNGVEVATVTDGTHASGLAGLACGNHTARFDNLEVRPAHAVDAGG